MTGKEVVLKAWDVCENFGTCGKFAGAAGVEIVKKALAKEGVRTSVRDVYVSRVPIEWDLIVPRRFARALLNGLVYEPDQVACALEIKLSGLHSEVDAPRIASHFRQAKAIGVPCAYITLSERKSYRHKATRKNIGFPVFTLAWHTSNTLTDTGDWKKLLTFLRKRASSR